MSFFYSATQYLRHRVKARKWNSFHSPYLFDLFSYACNERIHFDSFEAIELQRNSFKKSNEVIPARDLGAGSVLHENEKRIAISNIARTALSLPFQCRFMSRLAKHGAPKYVLELGTSLGISGAYLATGSPTSDVITVEGNPSLAEKAIGLYDKLSLKNIKVICQPFEDYILEKEDGDVLDLVFLDGHHQKSALLTYFDLLKPSFHHETIVIIDDIHWSDDMYDAWSTLIQQDEVTQSVDCFHFGLIFFRKDFLGKDHHLIQLPWKSMLG